jgi:toxin-antitoxin system PIN domain toxin
MMKRSFPDVNVWVALAVKEHIHHKTAVAWWDEDESDQIGFCRLTQLGLLRLLTTASAMGDRPRTNREAWKIYDAFYEDGRVLMLPELPAIDVLFRGHSDAPRPSPKVWSDCYLAAHAAASKATLITFDRAFSNYGIECKVLKTE